MTEQPIQTAGRVRAIDDPAVQARLARLFRAGLQRPAVAADDTERCPRTRTTPALRPADGEAAE